MWRSKSSCVGINAATAGLLSTIRVRAHGATALTRTPSRASSLAWLSVNAAMPALAAPYTLPPAMGCSPAADAGQFQRVFASETRTSASDDCDFAGVNICEFCRLLMCPLDNVRATLGGYFIPIHLPSLCERNIGIIGNS